jgi:hypothetical protein
MKLGTATIAVALLLQIGCRRDAAEGSSGETATCEVHGRMLASRVGYLPSPGVLVDPAPDPFTVMDETIYPHAIDLSFTDRQSDFASRRVTIHYCEECQRQWELAEEKFMKLSRAERILHQEAEMQRVIKRTQKATAGDH